MTISAQDHVDIERLMYQYARCADLKDYAGFADVFCEDAVFNYRGNDITPCSGIQETMHALEDFTCTLHQVHNVLFEVSRDEASGEVYCIASHLFTNDDTPMKLDMGIRYEDILKRTSNGWRIKHRKFNVLWTQTSEIDGADLPEKNSNGKTL